MIQSNDDDLKDVEMQVANDMLWPPEVDVIFTERKQIQEKEQERRNENGTYSN